jgi:hypothetical protein
MLLAGLIIPDEAAPASERKLVIQKRRKGRTDDNFRDTVMVAKVQAAPAQFRSIDKACDAVAEEISMSKEAPEKFGNGSIRFVMRSYFNRPFEGRDWRTFKHQQLLACSICRCEEDHDSGSPRETRHSVCEDGRDSEPPRSSGSSAPGRGSPSLVYNGARYAANIYTAPASQLHRRCFRKSSEH